MIIETERLLIRALKPEDEIPFIEMASDGSLNDVGFDNDCNGWMANWILEAKKLTDTDNPTLEYLAYAIELKEKNIVVGSVGCSYYDDLYETGITYFIGAKYRHNGYAVEAVKAYVSYFMKHYNIYKLIATVREENISSWKVVEKAGFELVEKNMYKDLNDEKAEMYNFYEIKNLETNSI